MIPLEVVPIKPGGDMPGALHICDKVGDGDIERAGESEQGGNREVRAPMLDVLNVLDVERRCPGKFLLGQPAFAPERRDPTADPAEGTLQLRAGPCLGAARWRTAFGL